MKIAVAIPCYNCEVQIVRLLNELDLVLTQENSIIEVFLIENNSSDNTLNTALSTVNKLRNREKFRIYQNLKNIGLGGTHKIAFTLANKKQFSHLVVLHGDHQASANDIPLLLQNLKKNNEITTLGSRFSDLRNLTGYSQIRKFGNLALNYFYSLFSGHTITDLGSGLNIFRISDFAIEDIQNFENDFTFNMDILLYMIKKNIPFQYVPIAWSCTDQISNAKAFSVGLKSFKKLISWRFSVQNKNQAHFETKTIQG